MGRQIPRIGLLHSGGTTGQIRSKTAGRGRDSACPEGSHTAAHRRSRGAFLLQQEVHHTLALCSQLQFLQLAVVVLVDHLLDRPEGEQ